MYFNSTSYVFIDCFVTYLCSLHCDDIIKRVVPISKLTDILITDMSLFKTTDIDIVTDIIQFIIDYIISDGFAVSHSNYH